MTIDGLRLCARRTVLACLGLVLLNMAGCAMSESSRLNALTTPEPDALRVRAMRRLSLATAYFEQGQNDVAQQEVRAALQIDPQFAEAYSLLGLIHQRDNAPELAEQSFAQALRLALAASRPAELAAVQHNQAWFLCQQNRFGEALALFTQALAQPMYRQQAKTWMAQGVCQQRAGLVQEARRSWQSSLQLDPINPITRYELSRLEWQAGQPDVAQLTLAPLNQSSQATAASLWLGIQLARALSQSQTQQALSIQLTQRFPHSAQAQALAQKNFEVQ
jgi:type IV pilus assembly protein PilF